MNRCVLNWGISSSLPMLSVLILGNSTVTSFGKATKTILELLINYLEEIRGTISATQD